MSDKFKIREITTFDRNVKGAHPKLGYYDKLYHIHYMNEVEETILGEWLCYHCLNNFIFLKESDALIAGGHDDNVNEWNNRFDPNKHNRYVPYSFHVIKLLTEDAVFFELTWL
jgi:hypothetical protein